MRLPRLLSVLLPGLLSVLLAACGDSGSQGSSGSSGSAQDDGPPPVFIWGKSGDAVKLDPAVVTDGESVMV